MSRWIAAIFILLLTATSKSALPASASTSYKLSATSWTLTAVGDIMLDRYVWTNMKKFGPDYPFKNIAPTLSGKAGPGSAGNRTDVVLANLEGPFTTSTRHAVSSQTLTFTFDPSLAPTLKQSGFTLLSLANNHTFNQGQRGLDSTRATLKQSGLEFFGDPNNRTGWQLTKTINGQRITFIGYHGLVAGLNLVIDDVRRAHQNGGYVVVMAHEGTEYQLAASKKQRRDYRQLVDVGADLVLGAHPHVVQPLELYRGKLIAYSLGNFVFDQYFSAETQRELLINIAFSPAGLTVNLVPLVSAHSQVAVATGAAKTTLLNRLAKDSAAPLSIRDGIRRGTFTIPK